MLMTIAAMLAAATAADAGPQDAAPAVVAVSAHPTLRAGTPIALRTDEELRSAAVRPGQRFQLRVAEPIVVDGHVFVAAGTPAVAEIVKVRSTDGAGYPDSIIARLVSVDAEGRPVRLVGGLGNRSAGSAGVIPLGASVRGFVDEDVVYSPAPPPPVRMAMASPVPNAPTVVEVVERPLAPAPVRVAAVTPPSGTSRNDRGSMTIDFLERKATTDPVVHPVSLRPVPERMAAAERSPARVATVTRTTLAAVSLADAGPTRTAVRVVRSTHTGTEVSSGGVTTRYSY